MQSHRDWLLAQHGSVCAYCGNETSPETITLDHVRPRRGQTAYDRPDNLVLACRECNAAKADTPLVAFLMQKRARGVFLLHYGDHLSDPLKELARQASERPMLPAGGLSARRAGWDEERGGRIGRPFWFSASPISLTRPVPMAVRMIRPCSAVCAAGYPSAGLARSGRPT